MDFEAIDAWLECRKAGNELRVCQGTSARTTWGLFAEQSRSSFGPPRGDMPEAPSLGEVATLVATMRQWEDPASVVTEYFPVQMPIDLQVAVVGNGHGWGDMYTRRHDDPPPPEPGRRRGADVTMLNALLIASQYDGTPQEQSDSAYGVLKHETVHMLFRAYRQTATTWSRWPREPDAEHLLQLLVLDEGIGHFVDAREELMRDGFPMEKADAALSALAAAATASAQMDDPRADAPALLRSASQGPYWDEFGSIGGMLMAYGVFEDQGIDGLRDAVRCGPGRLVADYERAAEANDQLPPLPEPLGAWGRSDLCDDEP